MRDAATLVQTGPVWQTGYRYGDPPADRMNAAKLDELTRTPSRPGLSGFPAGDPGVCPVLTDRVGEWMVSANGLIDLLPPPRVGPPLAPPAYRAWPGPASSRDSNASRTQKIMDHPIILSRLEASEVEEQALPLRGDVLARELEWTSVLSPATVALGDSWDPDSKHVGVFDGATLIGTGRLILSDDASKLPAGIQLGEKAVGTGPSGEISRVVVRREYRGCGVFRLLFNELLIIASAWARETVFISIEDNPHHRAFLSDNHFTHEHRAQGYTDGVIRLSTWVDTFILRMDVGLERSDVWLRRREGLLRDVRAALRRRERG